MSTVATAIIYLPTRMYISACKKSADGFGEKAKIDRLLKKILNTMQYDRFNQNRKIRKI